MVTRIYTPLVQPYGRPQKAGPQRDSTDVLDSEKRPFYPLTEQTGGEPTVSTGTDANADMSRPSAGLQSVLEQQRSQRIPLSAILQDFNSTMSALGADDQTRSEVSAYLNVVNLQAGKERPEVPFIKHTLRTAAGSLDQFITRALGQPSQVVKEWVDALLMQDIDYNAPGELPKQTLPQAAQEATEASHSELQKTEAPSARAAGKTRLKNLIEQAKAQHQAGHSQAAEALLQEALGSLEGQNRPDWEGRIHHLRGRFFDQVGDWQSSLEAYETAASKFAESGQPARQSQVLHATASILEERGKLPEAAERYRQVVALDEQLGEKSALTRSLNDLGSVYQRQGLNKDAIVTFQRAYREASAGQAPPKVLSDILSNLGSAYRSDYNYAYAEKAYRLSLQNAKQARDKQGYGSTLQQLAAMYVEANQPANAMKVLEKLAALER